MSAHLPQVRVLAAVALSLAALSSAAAAAENAAAPAVAAASAQAPDAFIKSITADVMATVKGDKAIQSGDLQKLILVVDSKIMPNVNFQRMTASAVGRAWRQATPEQRQRLQDEFKTMLVYTYAGAAAQIKDQVVEFKPMRNTGTQSDEVVVRTIVRGKGEPIQLDYRLERLGDVWKIYDVNVLGAWLVQTYQSDFAQSISNGGIDGLIAKLAERNKQLANKKVAG
jgi:phospholipid transport system substrate-binding protein